MKLLDYILGNDKIEGLLQLLYILSMLLFPILILL